MLDYKLVLVKWVSGNESVAGWEYLEDLEPLKPCTCYSVGFLLEDTDLYLTLAQSFDAEQVTGRLTIPCCCIQERIELLQNS